MHLENKSYFVERGRSKHSLDCVLLVGEGTVLKIKIRVIS